MKRKSWVKYLVLILLILAMIILRAYVIRESTAYFREIFRLNFCLLFIIMLINVGIGLLLGLEHLIREIKKDGTLKINLPKIIILGLPSLYFSFTHFFVYSTNQFVQNILAYPLSKFISYDSSFISVFQLMLGYIFITSFYKYNEKV